MSSCDSGGPITTAQGGLWSVFLQSTLLAEIAPAMLLASPATAADECGILPGGGAVACSNLNNASPNGITYFTPTDQIRWVRENSTIVITAGAGVEGIDIDGSLGVRQASNKPVDI